MHAKGAWITLDEVIYDYIIETEKSEHAYFKLFHSAIRGMDALGLNIFYQIKSVKIPSNATKSFPLPADYANYSKVGFINSRGEIYAFSQNSKLALYGDQSTERVSKVREGVYTSLYSSSGFVFYNFWDGNIYGSVYGLPSGGYNPTFRIDNNNGVIVLDTNFNYPYIILEYVALPTEKEEYRVPIQFREALIAWLAWKDIQNMPPSRKGSLGDKRDRRHEFYNERRIAIASYKPTHLMEAYNQSVENQRKAIKA